MTALPKPTPAQYLQQERAAKTKSEYVDGEIFAMAGASLAHNLIVSNLIRELGNQLRKRPCQTYPSDLRVRVEGDYFYPDASVVCGRPELVEGDTLTNPTLIVEVLSPSTADYDLGSKFARYRRLASLQDYLVVAQDSTHLIHHHRQDETHWLMTEVTAPEAVLDLPGVQCRLAMTDIYDKVFE